MKVGQGMDGGETPENTRSEATSAPSTSTGRESGRKSNRGRGRKRSGRGRTGAGKGKRRVAREMAVQMLYQKDMGSSSVQHVFENFRPEDYVRSLHPEETEAADQAAAQEMAGNRKLFEQAFRKGREMVQGTVDNLADIDAVIQGQADNWRLERMPAVDRNVLRLAVFELMFEPETPKLVVVDEAIELAKRFGTEQSARFINGLLDGLLKSNRHLRQPVGAASESGAADRRDEGR